MQHFALLQLQLQDDEDMALREIAAREEEAAALAAEAEQLLRLEKQAELTFGNDKQVSAHSFSFYFFRLKRK
jgi:hypothetical protein